MTEVGFRNACNFHLCTRYVCNENVIPPIITIIAVIKILIVKILFKFKNNSGIYSLMI